MNVIFALHDPYIQALNRIMELMKKKGPPKLWAFWRTHKGRRGWYALEGSHRIAAASRLALTPIIVPVTLNQTIEHDVYSLQHQGKRKVSDVLAYFDKLYEHNKASNWLEYRFRDLRGPRGGL